MRYWWVNQKQTYKHEVPGGYLWSPQRNNNGSRSQYYANMLEISPGDIVLSYAGGEIRAVGVALSSGFEAPKPTEFGDAGTAWADLGWRVSVDFVELEQHHRLRPKDYLEELLPLRPSKYSPIQRNGDSLTAYLFEMPEDFARVLLSRIESADEWHIAKSLLDNEVDLERLGQEKVEQFLLRAPLPETEKQALIAARRGQGRFRRELSKLEPACRFTGVRNPELLVASHMQPWHRCPSNEARLDPNNGLMLTPTYDLLFDHGLISFAPDRRLLISPLLPVDDVAKIKMNSELVTEEFRPRQQMYLAYHREHVFKVA